MTTTEILALAKKTLKNLDFKAYSLSLNNRHFTPMRIIAERHLDDAKDDLIEIASKNKNDLEISNNYNLANDLMNETLEFIIINSEVE